MRQERGGNDSSNDQRLKTCQVKAKSSVSLMRNISPKICSLFSMGGLFLFSCLHFLRQLEMMRPPDRRRKSPKPQQRYPLFPAKEFLHGMGQRAVGIVASRPTRASHGRGCSEKTHDLEQMMVIIVSVSAIMEDCTCKTLKILWCW